MAAKKANDDGEFDGIAIPIGTISGGELAGIIEAGIRRSKLSEEDRNEVANNLQHLMNVLLDDRLACGDCPYQAVWEFQRQLLMPIFHDWTTKSKIMLDVITKEGEKPKQN